MSRERKYVKLIRTIGITGTAYVVNYLITLVLTPYVTEHIGTDAFGFVSLAKNIAQYATYATLALNSLSGRYISVEYHQGKKDTANKYFTSTFYGDVFLATVIFAMSLVLVVFLDRVFQIPAGLETDVKLLFLLVFLKFWLVTVFSVYSVGAYVSNKLDITGIFKGISYVVEALIFIILFKLFKPNVAFVGVGLLLSSAVIVFSDIWITRRYTGDLVIRRSSFSMESVKTLVMGGVWASVTQLGNFLHNGLDLAICNLMLTPLAMGQLAIAQSMDLIFKSFISIVSHAFQPNLLKLYAHEDKKGLLKEFRLAMNLSAAMTNIAFAGFTALGMSYYRLWIPNQDINLIYKLTVICISTCISSGIVTPLYFIYSLTAKKMVSAMITLISGAVNVISMYFLIRYTSLGIYAVVWTTAVIVMVINFIAHPVYMCYLLKISWKTFYPTMLRNLLSCAAILAVFMLMGRLYEPRTWLSLGLCVIVYSLVGGILHLCIVMNRSEMNTLKLKLKQKIKKTDNN